MANAQAGDIAKHEPDQLWSAGLMEDSEKMDARRRANLLAETTVFRLFLIMTFCLVFLVCRYYMI